MLFLKIHITCVDYVHYLCIRIIKIQPPKLLQELGLMEWVPLLPPLRFLVVHPTMEDVLSYRPLELLHHNPNLLELLVEIKISVLELISLIIIRFLGIHSQLRPLHTSGGEYYGALLYRLTGQPRPLPGLDFLYILSVSLAHSNTGIL